MVAKNVTCLIHEIFSIGKNINVETSVEQFLPVLIKKAATDIGKCKQMDQQVLTSFCNNCGYDVSFDSKNFVIILVTAKSSVDKNVHIGEVSIKLLSGLIKNIGGALTKLKPETLVVIMKALDYHIHGKRQDLKSQCLEICISMYTSIGN